MESSPINYQDDVLSEERISRVVQHYQHSPDQACHLLLQLPRGKFAPPASSPGSAYTVHLKVLLCVLLAALVLRASWVYFTYTTPVFVLVCVTVVILIALIFEMVAEHNAEKHHQEQMKEHTHFYQKDDLVSLSQRSRSSESPVDQEAMGAEMAVFLQKWVNADPKNHNRLALFRVIRQHHHGTSDLARAVLEGTELCVNSQAGTGKCLSVSPVLVTLLLSSFRLIISSRVVSKHEREYLSCSIC